ncbi:MAG: hypothetical protein JST39_13870 [Bacteroidetes bacterium]|nr:hypothetical protein [Bacteroidota bacterium]
MSTNKLKVHAIILALNEAVFIRPQLDTIYPFCHAISIITQYDRDWYGTQVSPDSTVQQVLDYPDPEGKIHLCVRRLPDEAAARNMEMLSFNKRSYRKILSHGRPMEDIAAFHRPPDYFWVIDADELYDVATIPAMLEYLATNRPRGMRVTGYNYLRSWNQRVPREVVDFTHFGFIRPGLLFEERRIISWNEFRLGKILSLLRLPDISARIFGFVNCPTEVAVFHHACWLGNDERIRVKFDKSSHRESKDWKAGSVDTIASIYIPAAELPENIRNAKWPEGFISYE